MFERLRNLVLPLLKVPHEPTPPAGAPGSAQVFRAGRNFYKLRLLSWGIGQAGALAGIIFSLVMLDRLQVGVEAARRPAAMPAAAAPATPASPTPSAPAPAPETVQPEAAPPKSRDRIRSERAQARAEQFAARWPDWVFPLLKLAELGGILLYLLQLPVTYALARLDYELRWYIVTDRSLRIRSGLTKMQETTMSFANVQQVVVNQGPLQRLLGIADVHVQSAGGGGGGGDGHHKGTGDSLHSGVFHGVDNATEIRDLILERLRRFRETGLGDPDETHLSLPATTPPVRPADALAAAREVLAEARALRRMV